MPGAILKHLQNFYIWLYKNVFNMFVIWQHIVVFFFISEGIMFTITTSYPLWMYEMKINYSYNMFVFIHEFLILIISSIFSYHYYDTYIFTYVPVKVQILWYKYLYICTCKSTKLYVITWTKYQIQHLDKYYERRLPKTKSSRLMYNLETKPTVQTQHKTN